MKRHGDAPVAGAYDASLDRALRTRHAGVEFANALTRELDEVKELLLQKNQAYGNSALDPVRVFSKASPVEQLRVRIDDKLSRLARGGVDDGEDVVLDLIGYLVLLRIATKGGVE